MKIVMLLVLVLASCSTKLKPKVKCTKYHGFDDTVQCEKVKDE